MKAFSFFLVKLKKMTYWPCYRVVQVNHYFM